jgi:hypothetical protein
MVRLLNYVYFLTFLGFNGYLFADMSEVPTFFFFVPLWAFLFGYYAVTRSRSQDPQSSDSGATISEIIQRIQQRLGALESTAVVRTSSSASSTVEIGGLVYS